MAVIVYFFYFYQIEWRQGLGEIDVFYNSFVEYLRFLWYKIYENRLTK